MDWSICIVGGAFAVGLGLYAKFCIQDSEKRDKLERELEQDKLAFRKRQDDRFHETVERLMNLLKNSDKLD